MYISMIGNDVQTIQFVLGLYLNIKEDKLSKTTNLLYDKFVTERTMDARLNIYIKYNFVICFKK